MERRDFVRTGLAAAGLASGAAAAGAMDHQHGNDGKTAYVAPTVSAELTAVAETAHACVMHAVACIAECNRVLATGDASMAACQESVLSMVPVCEATAANATLNFAGVALMSELVGVCKEFCDYCADACEPHASHNAECKTCMDSCKECSEACQTFLNA